MHRPPPTVRAEVRVTLQELKYIVTVARERHFGRAAKACFVSQPALSAAVRKLEDELGVVLFDRDTPTVSVTPHGALIVAQAQRTLEAAHEVERLARAAQDPLAMPFGLGLIYTICPYLLPHWVPELQALAPQLQLLLQEGLTAQLLERLNHGELDAIVVAEPFDEPGIETRLLYEETLLAAAPLGHAWQDAEVVTAAMLARETVLLLTPGHCFRDQVLQACPDLNREPPAASALVQALRNSSLTTIRHMVMAGAGVTVLPATAVTIADHMQLVLRPLAPAQHRQVVLAWRRAAARPKPLLLLLQALDNALDHGRLPSARRS